MRRVTTNDERSVHAHPPERGRLAVSDDVRPRALGNGIDWAGRIRDALAQDGFSLLAQPIIDFATGRPSHYELLLRMVGDRELIPPSAFLHVAESRDMVQQIDGWVVSSAIALLTEHNGRGDRFPLAVNLSGRSVGDAKLLALIGSELMRSQVAPERLIFEITETAAVRDFSAARLFIEHLSQLGCRFALDDFGSGFGSFYYLKHFPFDFVKIDGEFVRTCCNSPTDRLVIKAIVDIARGLRIGTIAESVGGERTVDLLTGLGVEYGQGYHLGRPAGLSSVLTPRYQRA